MKVVIVNHSDMQGGAAIVSLRLVHALQEAGVDARMLVIDRQSDDSLVGVMGSKWRNKWNFLAERLGVFVRNGFRRDTLFKIDTGSHGINIANHPWVKDADVVCLNWVNQGTMSPCTTCGTAQVCATIPLSASDTKTVATVVHCLRQKAMTYPPRFKRKSADSMSKCLFILWQ